jgi:hypothetical protein
MENLSLFHHDLIKGVNTSAMLLMILIGLVFTQKLGLHYCRPFRPFKKTRKALVVALASFLVAIGYMIDGVLSWEHALTTFGMANVLYATVIKNFLTNNNNNHEQDQAKPAPDSDTSG